MKMFKIVGVVLIAGLIAVFGSEIGDLLSISGTEHLVPMAEARVGRPLTPVSVAGVARRSVRRCAVGVYCMLPESQSLTSLLESRMQGRSERSWVKSETIPITPVS